jgi:hypothetical protein
VTNPRIGNRGVSLQQTGERSPCLFQGEFELEREAGGAVAFRMVHAKKCRERFIWRQGWH